MNIRAKIHLHNNITEKDLKRNSFLHIIALQSIIYDLINLKIDLGEDINVIQFIYLFAVLRRVQQPESYCNG